MGRKEEIKDIFDNFEDERYTDAEDNLKKVFKQSINNHLKDKLSLKKDVIEIDDE